MADADDRAVLHPAHIFNLSQLKHRVEAETLKNW